MPKTLTAVLSLFLFISCASAKSLPDAIDPLGKDTFSFRAPTANDIERKLTLWGTYYYLPELVDGSGNFALRDVRSMELGPRLGLREWCNSAMEGSVRIMDKTGTATTYNYAGVTNENTVDCRKIFKIDVSKTKFREARGPYGDGLDDYILAPYRTLATDKNKIVPGTVVYVPEARGAKIILPNGRIIIHDGYFYAADKGGAIKENHVDVFIGTHTSAPFFPWIHSRKDKTFEAYIINDKKIISDLNELHTGR